MSCPRIKQLRRWVEQGKVTVTVEDEIYRVVAVHPFKGRCRWRFIGWDWYGQHNRIGVRSQSERNEEKQAWIETLVIDPRELNEYQVIALEKLVQR